MVCGSVSYATDQGQWHYQEDRFFFQAVPSSRPTGWLMAVMDGHGGSETAGFCAEEIHGLFSSCVRRSSPELTLRALVAGLNEKTRHLDDGTTLSIAWVREDRDEVTVAVLGDSPVLVMSRSGKMRLSPEHNVRTNLAERHAAITRGGSYNGSYICNRHGDGLQISRALGDRDLDPILSREPEVYTVKKPRWVIVGTDGMLDPGHGNTTALVRELPSVMKPKVGASGLMSWAKSRGLHDNATVLMWESGKR